MNKQQIGSNKLNKYSQYRLILHNILQFTVQKHIGIQHIVFY